MKESRRFVVLGLGTFGAALATRLSRNGCRVTGVDHSEHRVEALKDVLYEAVVADVTDRQALEQLSVKTADAVFVGLGEHFERSILAALHLKELGARRVLAKGVTREHGKILKQLGVEQVIYPEEEIAEHWADKVTWPNVLDFLPVDPEYSLVEIAVPNSLVGKTLNEANLRQKHGISVLAVKDTLLDKLVLIPGGDFELSDDQKLLAIGRQQDVDRFRELK